MVENIVQIKSGVMAKVGVSAEMQKNIMCAKKMFRILLHVVAKMINI